MHEPTPDPAPSPAALTLEPIGYVRCELATKVEAARQPRAARADTEVGPGVEVGTVGRIELLSHKNYEHALADLEEWEYIWVLFWFDRNPSWRPKVLPPRSRSGRKGVFATRSPHRPNPLGLSAVRLERIEGLTLHVRDIDMLDGTPVLDLKPYVAYTDAIAQARGGWIEDPIDASASRDPIADYAVHWDDTAAAQADWIGRRTGLALRSRVGAALALGPQPHPYRRIRAAGDAELELAVRDWRAHFTVSDRAVQVRRIVSGYRDAELEAGDAPGANLAAHRDFHARWPRGAG